MTLNQCLGCFVKTVSLSHGCYICHMGVTSVTRALRLSNGCYVCHMGVTSVTWVLHLSHGCYICHMGVTSVRNSMPLIILSQGSPCFHYGAQGGPEGCRDRCCGCSCQAGISLLSPIRGPSETKGGACGAGGRGRTAAGEVIGRGAVSVGERNMPWMPLFDEASLLRS